ncbi:serine/threonine-protein kinase Nek11 isoform X3 [Pseudophryne corroboree]|uniref:serine/threonine-protein kinase Nek11 isoform X3 n=1 Tax=Pseudophryne corroboree TaxID=495146 RepID=UPI003081CAFC
MPNYKETSGRNDARPLSACPDILIAKRYLIQQKLGRGSFGTVYLVLDQKAKEEDKLKVLKEISVGEVNPNETVQANLEAQLLSKLDHPAIVKFHASFLENASFCIITEYCEGRDLDCKIHEFKNNEESIPESQVTEWFIQLLLGVSYMHERRILHRDLKAKNIFLKNNLLKIGDFGVSRLLMGSCDLATTFTGTPYYMSPEALKHQGYDSKSDIWSVGCILHEMCCLEHAFTGHSFLAVVLKIVEGPTPSLPDRYSIDLNLLMIRMLGKDPSLRPGAGEILQAPYITEQLQKVQWKLYGAMLQDDKTIICQKEADQIRNAVQRKFHLQTLRELSEVQKMTPRERMRLRKLNAADEKAKRLKRLAEEKYQENQKRMLELRSRNFQRLSIDVLHFLLVPALLSSLVLHCHGTTSPRNPGTCDQLHTLSSYSVLQPSAVETILQVHLVNLHLFDRLQAASVIPTCTEYLNHLFLSPANSYLAHYSHHHPCCAPRYRNHLFPYRYIGPLIDCYPRHRLCHRLSASTLFHPQLHIFCCHQYSCCHIV